MNDKVKIAQVIGCNAKGGVESVVFNYYEFIDKTKFQFDFIIHNNSPHEIPKKILDLGCGVYKIPPYKHIFSYIKTLKYLFRKNSYTIVHSHMSTISIFTLLAAKLAKVPVRISHCHVTAGRGKGEFLRNIFKYILRPFSKIFPTHYFSCSEHAGKWLFGKKTFERGDVTVINNAINIETFLYNEQARCNIRKELNIDDKYVIGNVGRFAPQKNHSFMIEVFNVISKRSDNSILLLAGNGPLKGKIWKQIESFKLQDKVKILENVENISELYQAMDVFILPSLYEGLGMVAIEAQAAGLPTIVSTKVPKEAKLFDFTQFLDLEDSPETWAEFILAKRDFKRENVAGESSIKAFSIKNEAQKLEEIYQGLYNDKIMR